MTPLEMYYEATYRLEHHARPKQKNTVAQFQTDLRIFNEAFRFRLGQLGKRIRPVALEDLSDELLKFSMAWQLGRGRTEATANRLYRTIKAVWMDAFRRDLLPAPPRTKRYEEPKRQPRAWTEGEYSAILDACARAPGWVGAVLARDFYPAYGWFVYSTGARQGVTLALPTQCFAAERGEVTLPAELQKQNADQILTLQAAAVEAIARLRSAERGLDRLFGDFCGSVAKFNKRWRRIIVDAGLRESPDKVSRRELSHMIRRTFATHARKRGSLDEVRELLGHSHQSVTERYIDVTQVDGPSARDLLPALRTAAGAHEPPPQGPAPLRIFDPDDEPRRSA